MHFFNGLRQNKFLVEGINYYRRYFITRNVHFETHAISNPTPQDISKLISWQAVLFVCTLLPLRKWVKFNVFKKYTFL